MNNISLISLISLITLTPVNAKQVVTFGYFELPPFTYTQDDQPKGVAIDYIRSLFSKSEKYNVQFKHYPFQRLLVEVQKSRLDGAVLLGKIPDREKVFQYPKDAYISDRPAIVFKKDNSPKKISAIEDIKIYSIGVPEKAYISPFVRKNKNQLKLKYIPSGIDHLEPMMQSLARSRGIDGLYLPTLSTLVATAKKLGIYEKLSFKNTPERADKFYTVFSPNSSQNLLDFYNENNSNYISDTKLRKIISK
jgi:ABC-type amino acid transport substrate-binding protein